MYYLRWENSSLASIYRGWESGGRASFFNFSYLYLLSAPTASADISPAFHFTFVRSHRICGHFNFFSFYFCPLPLHLRTFLTLFLYLLSAHSAPADISPAFHLSFVRSHRSCGHFNFFSFAFCPLPLHLRTFLTLFLYLLSAHSAPADISPAFHLSFVRSHRSCGHFNFFSFAFCPLPLHLRTFHLLSLYLLSAPTASADISPAFHLPFVRSHCICGHFNFFSFTFCPQAMHLRTFQLLFLCLLSAHTSSADISSTFPSPFVRSHCICGHFTFFLFTFCPHSLQLRTFHLLFLRLLSAPTASADISYTFPLPFVRTNRI